MREYSTCMCTWSEGEGKGGVVSQLHFARFVVTAVLHNHIANFDVSRACSGHVCVCTQERINQIRACNSRSCVWCWRNPWVVAKND